MLLVSDLPGINAQSSLEAGVEPGTTDLLVQITKGRRLRVSFDADNFGTYYTGYYRSAARCAG
jgi:hemolysin activation/secretion protein